MLTKRWGIFWRPLHCSFHRWSTVITVAAKLHNFCINENVPIPLGHLRDRLSSRSLWYVMDNHPLPGEDDDGRNLLRPTGAKRGDITRDLEIIGAIRPPHAKHNSKA